MSRTAPSTRAHDSRPRRESVRKRIGAAAAALIAARDGWQCVYCGGEAESLDHLKPRSRGGADAVANLVCACRRCNSARRDMPLAAWERYAAQAYGLQFSVRAISRRAKRAA